MRKIIVFLTTILGFFQLSYGQTSSNLCVTEEEMKLYNLIDFYRKPLQLHQIPISHSLTFVAKLHARDLVHNRGKNNHTSIHSWSNQGTWEACEYEKTPDKGTCMWNKPKELTSYQANGYELITIDALGAEAAFNDLVRNSEYSDMFQNKNDWKDKDWGGIGIAIYEQYTVIWLGELPDKAGTAKLCKAGEKDFSTYKKEVMRETKAKSEEEKVIKTSESDKDTSPTLKGKGFYLIYGSYETQEYAEKALEKIKNDGFGDALVFQGADNGRFRVAIGQYQERSEAENAKSSLASPYDTAWILFIAE